MDASRDDAGAKLFPMATCMDFKQAIPKFQSFVALLHILRISRERYDCMDSCAVNAVTREKASAEVWKFWAHRR